MTDFKEQAYREKLISEIEVLISELIDKPKDKPKLKVVK